MRSFKYPGFQESGSQQGGATLPPGDMWQCLETILSHLGGGCSWHPVGRGQRGCWPSCKAQDSPTAKNSPAHISSAQVETLCLRCVNKHSPFSFSHNIPQRTHAPEVEEPRGICRLLMSEEVVCLSYNRLCVHEGCHVQLLCNPMDCNPPSSSVHGILQARILE